MNSIDKTSAYEDDEQIVNLLKSWRSLKELGFKFEYAKSHVLADGNEVIRLFFSNKEAHRIVKISVGFGIGPIWIKNTNTEESFSIQAWLVHHSDTMPRFFSKDRYLQVMTSFKNTGIKPLLGFLEALFHGPLKPIVIGDSWENPPVDWDGYK